MPKEKKKRLRTNRINPEKNKKRKTKDVQRKSKRRLTKKKDQLKNLKQLIGALLLTVMLTISIFWILSLVVFSLPRVDGYSMSPTLNDGDRLLVYRLSEIRRFRLVCIKDSQSGEKSIQRIIGLPGETIRYHEDTLYVNGQEKPERFLEGSLAESQVVDVQWTEDFSVKTLTGQEQIPAKKYLVLGDNRPYATDSRYYGLIDEKEIIGVVKIRLLPFHRMTQF